MELTDNRLPYETPREFKFDIDRSQLKGSVVLEVKVRYHLLDETRRRRIGYQNQEPISYTIFEARRSVDFLVTESH